MDSSAENAPLFIEAFWKCCVNLEQSGLAVPDIQIINAVLAKHDAGQGRRAVQEILFLLESITTAFRGMGEDTVTIQGKYFGPIISEMKKRERGKAQENIFTWMTTLHGYLSSPTGGCLDRRQPHPVLA